LVRSPEARTPGPESRHIESYAGILLRRYGVVFHKMLTREPFSVPWRELLLVYRRLEARGDIRGGRFVAGVTGEQFALPEAVVSLRAVRRESGNGALVAISAADPLNLMGIITPGERVSALARNRILYEDGVPIAVLESGETRFLKELAPEDEHAVKSALVRRSVSPSLRLYLGIPGRAPRSPDQIRRRKKATAGS
jgi:ATP-dependent Lhr-like helicase